MELRNKRTGTYQKLLKNVTKLFCSNGELIVAFLINQMQSRNTKSVWLPCFVQIPKQQRDKLDPKATKCIFIGYPNSQKGYQCYLHEKNGIVFVIMTQHIMQVFTDTQQRVKRIRGSLSLLFSIYLLHHIKDPRIMARFQQIIIIIIMSRIKNPKL